MEWGKVFHCILIKRNRLFDQKEHSICNMNRCTLVTNFNYGIYWYYILVFLFSDTIFICGWTCLSNCVYPTKKRLKNCATISKVYSWIQTTLSPQTGHGCLTTWYTTCWYKTSCTTSYPWNLVEKKRWYSLHLSICFYSRNFLPICLPYNLPSKTHINQPCHAIWIR